MENFNASEGREVRALTNRFSHLARVSLVDEARRKQIVTHLQERYTYEEGEDSLYFWDAEISNTLLDSHFTHMSEKTLQNYAEDAQQGVAFLKGHKWTEIPIGYSVDATYEENAKKNRVVAGFYTVRGIPEADDLIIRMKTGLLRDVSVGFFGGRMICDLCGQDFWDCRHFPGLKYEEKDGDTIRIEISTFTIEDARLSEVSGVFDGSTPDAMILKAERAAKAGELTMEQVSLLEKRYRIHLPTRTMQPVSKPKEGNKMEDKSLQRIAGILVNAKIITEEERTALDEETTLVHIDKMASRLQGMESQAADGRQYRTDLVNEALAEGVRAYGNDFDKETYESTLKGASIKTIQRMRDDWKKTANAALPAGRSSQDEGDAPVAEKPINTTPVEAYM